MKYLGQSFYIIVAPNPGADATRYWLTVNANQIKRNSDGTFTPGSVVAARMQQVGQSSPSLSTTGNIKFIVHYKNGTSSTTTNYLAPVVVRMDMLDVIFSYYIDNIVVDTQTVTILADGESAVTYEIAFADENGLAANTIPCNDKGVPQLGQEYFANLYQIVGSTKSLCNLYYARIKYTDTATGAQATEESGMATGIYDFRVADYNYFTVQFYNPVNLKVIAESSIGKVYNGSAGLPGPAGEKNAMPYPSGVWSPLLTYTMTKDITPMVLYGDGNTYYVMNKIGSVTGLNPSDDYADKSKPPTWIPLENFEAAYFKIVMANFSKLASAVFYDNYMFSQQGIDAVGNATSNYRDFDANRLDEPNAPFRPNLIMDFLKGGFNIGDKFRAEIGSDGKMNVTIDGSVLAQSIMATGLNINDNFIVDNAGDVFIKGSLKNDIKYITASGNIGISSKNMDYVRINDSDTNIVLSSGTGPENYGTVINLYNCGRGKFCLYYWLDTDFFYCGGKLYNKINLSKSGALVRLKYMRISESISINGVAFMIENPSCFVEGTSDSSELVFVC